MNISARQFFKISASTIGAIEHVERWHGMTRLQAKGEPMERDEPKQVPVKLFGEWARVGECNACGDCCRQATNLITIEQPLADEAYGRARYGAPIGVENGLPVFAIRGPILAPCPSLDGDRCSVHETKPDTCRDSPFKPEDIEGLPRCSYLFVNMKTGEARDGKGLRTGLDGATIRF